MANKKISELDSRASLSLSDLMAVGDPATGYLYKTTISDLKTLTGAGVISFNGRVGAIVPTEGDYNLTQLGDVIITSVTSGQFLRYNGSNFVNTGLSASDIPDLSATYQPLDGDLTTIAGLTGTGILKRTGTNTWSLLTDNTANWDTAYTDRNKWDGGSTGLVAATGRTSLGLVIGTNVQAWDADLDAIAALAGTSGFLKKTAANTWSLDTNTYLTTAAGAATYEPIITAGTTGQYWRGDKTWQTLPSYSLPIASATVLGGIKVGSNLSINATTGVLDATYSYSLPISTASVLGGVKIGSGVSVDAAGVISVSTNYQAPLNGTGFVKASGTTISYDNKSYLPTTGGDMTGNISYATGSSTDWFIDSPTNGPWISMKYNSAVAGFVNRSGALGFKDGNNVRTTALRWDDSAMEIYIALASSSSITATSFIKTSGTSSQFLKADGSVDSSAYITSAALSSYVPYTGATSSVNLGAYGLQAGGTITTGRTTSDAGGSFIMNIGNGTNTVGSANSTTIYSDTAGRLMLVYKNTTQSKIIGISAAAINNTQTYLTWPSSDGTIALTSDIPSLTGYLTETNSTYSVNKYLELDTGWKETGINSSVLAEGTYLVKCYVDNYAYGGGQYTTSYVGIMYWRGTGTNSSNACEIPLHHSGHSDGGNAIYLRTQTTLAATDGKTFLQIRAQGTISACYYGFTFKRLL